MKPGFIFNRPRTVKLKKTKKTFFIKINFDIGAPKKSIDNTLLFETVIFHIIVVCTPVLYRRF